MNKKNPYNCAKPFNLFVGHKRLLSDILNGFQNNASFAILGGRRCGKTSLLLRIKEELQNDGLGPFKPLPRFLDIQGIGKPCPDLLFEKIYTLTVQDVDAMPWKPGRPEREYENFLSQLDAAKEKLDQKYGFDWVVVLLVDELDAAISNPPDDRFFQNLRNLLMISRFQSHYRLVASGVKGLANLIFSGSSPLNNLCYKYLSVLPGKEARKLMYFGFQDAWDPEIELFLFKLTGRHPYLLQGILGKLWGAVELTREAVKNAAREFLREHHDFNQWMKAFGSAEHAVYQCLARTPGEPVGAREIRRSLDPALAGGIDDALNVLSYHGVIDDADPDEPQIAGTLFLDWYKNNYPEAKGNVAPPAPTPSAADGRTPSLPSIHVEVKPIFNVEGPENFQNTQKRSS